MNEPLLLVRELAAGYGEMPVLEAVTLKIVPRRNRRPRGQQRRGQDDAAARAVAGDSVHRAHPLCGHAK